MFEFCYRYYLKKFFKTEAIQKIIVFYSIEMTDKIKQNDLIFSIRKEEKTALITGYESHTNEIIIPSSIVHESIEYIIIGISKMAFMFSDAKKIQLSFDSELKMIGKQAFYESSIESISIPSNFVKFEEGWNTGASKLTNIIISPTNPYYKSYENNKLVLKKSSNEKEIFDVLFFCNKNVQTVTIPNFIEIIGSSAFDDCRNLKRVDIQSDSKLRIIEQSAFLFTSIEYFIFPHHLTKICQFSFSMCDKLSKVVIPNNSDLQIIESNAFCSTSLRSIFIPANIKQLDVFAFLYCNHLKIFEIDENVDIGLIDKKAFCQCKDAIIMVPMKLSNIFNNTAV